jgi:uncharacterized protein (DUF2384 family)
MNAQTTISKWARVMSADAVENLTARYRAAELIAERFSSEEAQAWMSEPNALFGGERPWNLLGGSRAAEVVAMLEAGR